MIDCLNITHLLSVLVGGLVAFVPSWIFYNKKRKDVIKFSKREKLEQLVRETYSLRWWFSKVRANNVRVAPVIAEVEQNYESYVTEITTFVSLYFSELVDDVNSLGYHADKYYEKVMKVAARPLSADINEQDIKVLDAYHEELSKLTKRVASKCRRIMSKLESDK